MVKLKIPKLKMLILGYLRNHEDGTTFDISEEIGQDYHSTANALLRCRRQQLIGHTNVKGGPRNRLRKVYSMQPKGLARLLWYEEEARKAQESPVRSEEPSEEKPRRKRRPQS